MSNHKLYYWEACLSFCLVALICCTSALAQTNPNYTFKNFGTYYQEFPTPQDLIRFMDFKSGDIIGDVGADDGMITCALSLLYDSLTFYAEDTDPKQINQKHLNKYVSRFTKLRNTPQTNQFHFVTGTYKCTNLPDQTFDKILMAASFHEFTYMDEMLDDLTKKLKPGGKLYILEAFSSKTQTIYCEKHHKGYRIDEVTSIMSKHGFYLTRMRSPESNVLDYSNCLVFERDLPKSERFNQAQTILEPVIRQTALFADSASVLDPAGMSRKTDSIKAVLTDISFCYSGYESWMIGIGKKWMSKNRYLEAIPVFESIRIIFPDGTGTLSMLGQAYEGAKQNKNALTMYQKALALDTGNEDLKKRIFRLRKKA